MTSVVNHVGICVTDRDRSRRFYEAAFGFIHRADLEVGDGAAGRLLGVSPPVGLTAVYLELGTFVLELLHFHRDGNDPARDRTFTEPGLTHLSLGVAAIDATCELVRQHGGEVLETTRLGADAVMVKDPDGQLLELLPRRRPAPLEHLGRSAT